MKAAPFLALCLLASSLRGQTFSRLPDWAAQAAQAASTEQPPADADAWVLLNRTEMAYAGDGEVRVRKLRLVKVLGERGIDRSSVYVIYGLGGRSSRIKKLKGWNLRPDNELVKLDQDNVVTVDGSGEGAVDTGLLTGAVLERVAKGSYVAFESLEVLHSPLGPVEVAQVMERDPIRRWELQTAQSGGWFFTPKPVAIHLETRHTEPWIAKTELAQGQGVTLSDVPALPKDGDEEAGPDAYDNAFPWVLVRFEDPDLKALPDCRSWDSLAKWIYGQYQGRFQHAAGLTGAAGRPVPEALKAIHAWMGRQLTYKQVYLSPERGWIPEDAPETVRKRYGDCKDLATCFIAEAQAAGLRGYPVLARIVEGEVEPDAPVYPFCFNHAIAALRLEKSLGFPAEFETPQGRFLLVDETDPFTPLGLLPSGHRGRRLLICTEQGGVWVTVPDSAVQRPALSARLEGQASASGEVEATLTLQETGDMLELRASSQLRGAAKLKEVIQAARLLDLPPTATLEVLKQGDPMDLDHPFEVVLKLRHPQGLRASGSEMDLVPWVFPSVPGHIQKTGHPRRLPVWSRASGELDYSAELKVPESLSPVLPERHGEDPFRRFDWKAEAQPDGSGTVLRFSLKQLRTPVRFDAPHQEEGLAAWKKDRSLVKALVEDGPAFKLKP